MLVSIVINNYNYARFLAQAIHSALDQRYPHVEVIVVDDGSTDHSRAVMASFGARITPIYKENGGQASAFNAGFAHSHGEVVIFLDADDTLTPDAVARVVDAFHSQPDAAKVMARMEVIDAAGERTGQLKPHAHLPLRSGDLRRHVLSFPFDMTWMATSGNAFAAATLRRILPIPQDVYGRVGADWYLSLLTPLFGPVIFLDAVGACYRVHGGNNYELAEATVDLDHIRQTVDYAQRTLPLIAHFAREVGLRPPAPWTGGILSVSLIAQRLTLLKLDPQHPLPGDKAWRLFLLGMVAAWRRFDVSWPMRIAFMLWFAAMSVAPRPLALWLAEQFHYPERRGGPALRWINRWLGKHHRPTHREEAA
jgi:glycosyltransferase involved in cell wall biosynthesis